MTQIAPIATDIFSDDQAVQVSSNDMISALARALCYSDVYKQVCKKLFGFSPIAP